jgi:phosphatidylserine decarboxylase precursor
MVTGLALALGIGITASACSSENSASPKKYWTNTQQFVDMVNSDPKLKTMLQESIDKAKAIVPDKNMNPGQTIDEFYAFLNWSEKASSWNILENIDKTRPHLMERIDQSLVYFYFIFDQELPDLKDAGQYRPSLQYYEPIVSWMVKFTKDWGVWLSTQDSWSDDYLKIAEADPRFGVSKGWYEDSKNWHSFNDFFARKLKDPSMRPISNADMVSPADSEPQGVWSIDKNSKISRITAGDDSPNSVDIKSENFESAADIVGPDSKYKNDFAGGTLTHTFLNVQDYHRYHFPIDGTVKEINCIPAADAIGGVVTWDKKKEKYILSSTRPDWESIETRCTAIIDNPDYGLVALIPVGMSQVSSVNFEDNVKVGATFKKGDPLGWFYFGGSDFVTIFQKGIKVDLIPQPNQHILMGEPYAKLTVEK